MMSSDSLPLRSLVSAAAFSLLAAMASPAAHMSALQSQSAPPAASQPAASGPATLTGRPWKLISLNGHDLDPKLPKAPQISLVENGARIVGFSGCNRFLATYSLQQDRLSINSDLQVTRRVCPIEMDVEANFLRALQSIDSWKIVDGVLELSRQKQVLARFQ